MLTLWYAFTLCFLHKVIADRPCAARHIEGESIVCVCNATYCDSFEHKPPVAGKYVAYTSSKAGLRFEMATGDLKDEIEVSSACCSISLEIDSHKQYQTIEGFGGAVTDAAGINWRKLSEAVQSNLIQSWRSVVFVIPITSVFTTAMSFVSYCSDAGLKYNMLRVPIGGCDFSTHPYTYNESPTNDGALSNYTLSPEDYQYKLPMIKACASVASNDMHIVASTWSPPAWMKSNGKITGFSRLKEEYYQTYADYHLKFLQKYKAEGVQIWAITTTNEPLNGIIPVARFNSLGWTPSTMAKWIIQNLGPTIRKSEFKDVKILACDDQRFTIPIWFNKMVSSNSSVLDYIDGVAVHYYWDKLIPVETLAFVTEKYPSKFLIATEACEGSKPWDLKKVVLGSWSRAENYIKDVIEDLVNSMVGWIDWNLCLSPDGGPNWANNLVDSPILVFANKNEFVKQPMFYALGHFSKFIPRGSRRIDVKKNSFFSIENLAVITPNNTIVVVLYNGHEAKKVRLQIEGKAIQLNMDANSIMTIEIKP